MKGYQLFLSGIIGVFSSVKGLGMTRGNFQSLPFTGEAGGWTLGLALVVVFIGLLILIGTKIRRKK